MENKKVIDQWDKAAQSYADNQRNAPNNLTNWQIIKDVLGNIKNIKILDAGCGDGFFSNELASLGNEVSACDGSSELIKIAKKDFSNVDFKVCDLMEKLDYQDNTFDMVISSLVLMDIEEIDTFLKESNRVLKEKGKLIFTIVHPCFFQADWEYGENKEKLYKKVGNYWNLNKEILNFWGETTHYHRPISWYSHKLRKHGFLIQEIKENPDNVEKFKPIKPHQRRVPLFICFSCVKEKR
ncbi:MAG: class I SAM-dependent methyltransferase [Erysipelotrichaceae bacterium]|nr:class I SAM-dependent methyltransferase [Erysipelotrichaceae bacterium]